MTSILQVMLRDNARLRMIILAAVCCFSASASAQTHGGPSPYTDLSQFLLSPSGQGSQSEQSRPSSRANVAIGNQIGLDNRLTSDVRGSGNTTIQLQNGADNASSLIVTGAQNSLLTTQIGDGNSVDLKVAGNGNTINQTQIGNNLSYGLSQVGNGKTISVQQVGSR